VDVLDLAGQLLVPLQHVGLRRLPYTVEPTENHERQDDLPVLRLLVVAAEQVRPR
jgi:hypothetical protein